MEELVLYSYYRSSTAYRARIALHWKKLKFETRTVHLLEGGGQQHRPDYKALNPAGEVPTLIHKGQVISQSVAIVEYLDEVFKEPGLYSGSAYDRAKIRQICENINSGIHPLQNLKTTQYLQKNFGVTQDQVTQWYHDWVKRGLQALEDIVKTTSKNYAYGNTLSAADVFIVPQLFSAQRFGVDISKYPTLEKINKICSELDAFKLAHPYNQPDTPPDQRIS